MMSEATSAAFSAGAGVPCKLFVGGISSQTSTEALHQHFSKYGRLIDAVVMSKNGRARGFGFVTYDSTAPAVAALAEPQWLDGRLVDVKRAVPGERTQERSSNKIFVGGLPQDITTDNLKDYFGAYGSVADAVVMVDRRTNRSRGFGFVRFANGPQGSAAAQAVLLNFPNHRLQGKWVEVKPATPAAVLQELSPCSSDGSGASPMAAFLDPQMSMFLIDQSACGWDPSSFGMISAASPVTNTKGQHGHARGRRGRRRTKKAGAEPSGDEAEETTAADDDDLLSCFTGSSFTGSSEGSPLGYVMPLGLGGAGATPFVPNALRHDYGQLPAQKPQRTADSDRTEDSGLSRLSLLADPAQQGRSFGSAGGRKVGSALAAAGRSSENDPGRANAASSLLASPMKVQCREELFETIDNEERFEGFTRDDFLALEVHRPSAGAASW